MPITVACACGAKFAAKDELAGKRVKCPKCGDALQIPSAETRVATPTTKRQAPAPEPSAVGSILDELGTTASKTGQRCPQCSADMKPGAILCIACGYNIETGKRLATKSDAAAEARREAQYAKQRAKAERAARNRGTYSSTGTSSSSHTDGIVLAWERGDRGIGQSMGSAWQLIFGPRAAFQTLPPKSGFGPAVMMPLAVAACIQLIVAFVLLPFVILAGAAVNQMAPKEDFPILAAYALFHLIVFLFVAICMTTAVFASSGLSHVLLMAGGQLHGFRGTAKVVGYSAAAAVAALAVPYFFIAMPISIIGLFMGMSEELRLLVLMLPLPLGPIVFIYVSIVGFIDHQGVNGAFAVIAALLSGVVFVVVYAVMAILVPMMMGMALAAF